MLLDAFRRGAGPISGPISGSISGAVAVLVLAGSAAAQDRSERLVEMYRHLPAALASAGARTEIEFFDLDAGYATLGTLAARLDPLERIGRAFGPQQMDLLGDDLGEGLPARAGFGTGDIRHGVTVTAPPDHAMILALRPGAGAAVGPALERGGYRADARADGLTLLLRGDADGSPDLAARDDPFGRRMGLASRVVVRDDVLFQSGSLAGLDALLAAGTQTLADSPRVAPLFAALDAPAFDGQSLVRAWLLTDPTVFEVSQGLPGDASAEQIAAVREALGLDDGPRIPPWTMALYADLGTPTLRTGALLLSFASRDDAAAAQEIIARAWAEMPSPSYQRTFAEIFGAMPEFAITGDAPATLAILLSERPDPENGMVPANRPYERLLGALFRRDMPFLSPN